MVVNGICMVSVIMVSSVKTTIGLKEGNAKVRIILFIFRLFTSFCIALL